MLNHKTFCTQSNGNTDFSPLLTVYQFNSNCLCSNRETRCSRNTSIYILLYGK